MPSQVSSSHERRMSEHYQSRPLPQPLSKEHSSQQKKSILKNPKPQSSMQSAFLSNPFIADNSRPSTKNKAASAFQELLAEEIEQRRSSEPKAKHFRFEPDRHLSHFLADQQERENTALHQQYKFDANPPLD